MAPAPFIVICRPVARRQNRRKVIAGRVPKRMAKTMEAADRAIRMIAERGAHRLDFSTHNAVINFVAEEPFHYAVVVPS